MVAPVPRQSFPELRPLSDLIDAQPESFALGSDDIRATALTATKFLFDLSVQSEKSSSPHIIELLGSLEPSSAPRTRSQSNANGKRLRSPSPQPPKPIFELTPLNILFVEGMNDDQIWAQLDLRATHVCDTLERVLEGGPDGDRAENDEDESMSEEEEDPRLTKALEAMENGEDIDFDSLRDLDLSDSDEDAYLDESSEMGSDDDGEDEEGSLEDAEDFTEGVVDLHNPSSDESEDEDSRRKPTKKVKLKGHSQLDDGFFDLASFNAETERAEARSFSKGRLGGQEDSDDDDDNMSINLFAPLDDDVDDEGDDEEPMYGDFFEPPPKVVNEKPTSKNLPSKVNGVRFHDEVRVKKIKAKGKNLPLSSMDDDSDEEEGSEEYLKLQEAPDEMLDEGSEDSSVSGDDEDSVDEDESGNDESGDDETTRDTIERLKDDLFAEEDGLNQDLSTHEKRMAELRDQISKLESENVGPKDWVLMGEAGSRSRPQNSLLEEDLEFERAMKAVPVITEEIVQALEDRIKARILEGRFDDVVRIRPVVDKPFLPSRFFELKDTKSSQSLAQIYEDEFVGNQTGGSAGDDRDGKLKKEHAEIEKLWEGICHKLDALCNSHFMPKQPKATISTLSNVSTASLESALPTTKSVSTMLAPEEVFAPSSSEPRSRSELTPSEKRALRGKERKAKKKLRDTLEKNVDKYAMAKSIGGVKKQKRAALESVVKSGKGVTVVGKAKDSSTKKNRSSRP
ncbi:hypothetical protein H0H81_002458 [Sphagnurus paluster]|uniref:U3 small nucleolar ribonucleoprotein protein MPP10 n=1 Tax=Sphagnurus paluster TaxID=117069 RepID=A0A9P7GMZ7_9AGAR|nr:hypothetical protein H0H81_002458 [Sphagnurus paluster]